MKQRKIALVVAVGFFFGWLGILYAGADHPPPPGFLLIIFLDLGCSLVVFFRVGSYLNWSKTRKKNRFLLVLLDGFTAGIAVAAITLLIPGGGEPGVQPTLDVRLIWFAVLGVVGAVNSVIVYGVSAALSRELRKS